MDLFGWESTTLLSILPWLTFPCIAELRYITAWAFLFNFPFLTPEIYTLKNKNQANKQTKTKPKGKDDVYYDYVFLLLADE